MFRLILPYYRLEIGEMYSLDATLLLELTHEQTKQSTPHQGIGSPSAVLRQREKKDDSLFSRHRYDAESGRYVIFIEKGLGWNLKPKEIIRSLSYSALMFRLAESGSYGEAVSFLNDFLHRPEEDRLSLMTAHDGVEHEGMMISSALQARSREVLSQNGFDPETLAPAMPVSPSIAYPECTHQGIKEARRILKEINSSASSDDSRIISRKDRRKVRSYEGAYSDTVYVMVDDVGVKKQKDSRKEDTKQGKVVENTDIRIEEGGRSYHITAVGSDNAFRRFSHSFCTTGSWRTGTSCS